MQVLKGCGYGLSKKGVEISGRGKNPPRGWAIGSRMKSAGKLRSNSACPRWGYPHWANGMHPESNQQSMTSETRRIVPAHALQEKVTWSIQGLCTMRCSLNDGSRRQAALKWSNACGL